jgi:hypothetical protein
MIGFSQNYYRTILADVPDDILSDTEIISDRKKNCAAGNKLQ